MNFPSDSGVASAFFLLSLALAGPVCAQQVATAGPAPTVIVTGTRSPQPINRLPAGVTVIDRTQIEASGATHLDQVLRQSGLVQVSDIYGDGSRAQVDARGFGDTANANTLVLVDGRRLNNSDITPPDLNSVALRDVERIEILQGSAGALYGDQAVGGVINIITRAPGARAYALEAEGGSYDALGVKLRAADRAGALAWRLSGGTRSSDNYRDHNQIRQSNALGRADWITDGGSVFAEAGFIAEDLQTPGAMFENDVREDRRQALPNFRNDFSDTRTQTWRVGADRALGASPWRALAEATYRRSEGDFRISFASGASGDDSLQERKLGSFNPRLVRSLSLAHGEGTLTLGADAQRSDYLLSSPLGQSRGRQEQLDAYAQVVLPMPLHTALTLGVRHSRLDGEVRDDFSFVDAEAYGDDQTAGGLGLAWQPAPAWRLYTRIDRNYRYPKIDELTVSVPFGAPASILLDTQHGWSTEAGIEWRGTHGAVELSAFRLVSRDEIAFDPVNFLNFNLDRTRRTGATLSLRWLPLPALTLAANARYVDAEVTDGDFKGQDVPLVASRGGSLSGTWQVAPAWRIYAELQGIGRRPLGGDFDNSLDELPGHGLLNSHLQWQQGRWTARLRINNLLDHEYSEYGGSSFDAGFAEVPAFYPSPGTNGRLSLAYAW